LEGCNTYVLGIPTARNVNCFKLQNVYVTRGRYSASCLSLKVTRRSLKFGPNARP